MTQQHQRLPLFRPWAWTKPRGSAPAATILDRCGRPGPWPTRARHGPAALQNVPEQLYGAGNPAIYWRTFLPNAKPVLAASVVARGC